MAKLKKAMAVGSMFAIAAINACGINPSADAATRSDIDAYVSALKEEDALLDSNAFADLEKAASLIDDSYDKQNQERRQSQKDLREKQTKESSGMTAEKKQLYDKEKKLLRSLMTLADKLEKEIYSFANEISRVRIPRG